ncbi:MAG: zinc metallopeptidase [Clostridia bacterium]|nr:zinc metallopeptidase [Clostridia bacterium]
MKYFIIALVVLFVIILIASATSFSRLLRAYKKYDAEIAYCNMTGLEFAYFMIRTLGLSTNVVLIDGELDECYYPKSNTICITTHTAYSKSVSSICITAHELGHAYQHKHRYKLYMFQTFLQILNKISNFIFPFLVIAGVVLLFFPEQKNIGVILLIVALVLVISMFMLKVLTIPVEVQASRIAHTFLDKNYVLNQQELRHGKKVLDRAAGTYYAGLFMPIVRFLRSIGRGFGR